MIYDVKARFTRRVSPRDYEHAEAEISLSLQVEDGDYKVQAGDLLATAKSLVLSALGKPSQSNNRPASPNGVAADSRADQFASVANSVGCETPAEPGFQKAVNTILSYAERDSTKEDLESTWTANKNVVEQLKKNAPAEYDRLVAGFAACKAIIVKDQKETV